MAPVYLQQEMTCSKWVEEHFLSTPHPLETLGITLWFSCWLGVMMRKTWGLDRLVNLNFGILKVIYSTMEWTVTDLGHFTVSSTTDEETSNR